MSHAHLAALLHAVGFVTGLALYAMLGAMVLRAERRGARPSGPDAGRDRVALATAALGLLWNGGALLAYGAPGLLGAGAAGRGLAWVGAVAFAALGLLPAVAVHAALQAAPAAGATAARAARGDVALTVGAWALSAGAAALQLAQAARGAPVPAAGALQLLAVGYAGVVALLAARLRRAAGGRAPLAAAGLAAFAVMALHLGHHGRPGESLLAEALGDHASIGVALVILYQDFRFALADLFLKRVLSLLVLVGAASLAYLAAAPVLAPRLARDATDPGAVALLLALWVATAAAYPAARRGVHAFVDRFVLRRADYDAVRQRLVARLAALDDADAVLDATCAALRDALAADAVAWREAEGVPTEGGARDGAAPLDATPRWTDARRHAVEVRVPTADAPAYVLAIGALRGGRRLLSDDLALLESAALAAARRLDALRMAHERWARDAHEREIRQLATEAELRALRAQLDPHFLFNALTTVGHLLQEAPERALATLLRLTGLLRAVLRPAAGGLVTLGEEMDIVEAYLAIEQARFEERLRVRVDVPDALRGVRLPALLVQPLVENAVKHGIAPRRTGGEVRVVARLEPAPSGATTDAPTDRLHLVVADSGAGVAEGALAARRGTGVGLASVEQRLARHYGGAAAFAFRSVPGEGTTVELRVPLVGTPDAGADAGATEPAGARGRVAA